MRRSWYILQVVDIFIKKVSVSQFSCPVIFDSFWPHRLQHVRLPCPSLSPRVCSNSCPLSQWCHLAISSCVVPFSSCLQFFPSIRVFSYESALCIWWPKYWSFSISISPSKEYSGFISFRIDWLDLLAVQGTQEFSSTSQFKSINSSVLSFLYSTTHVYPWLLENHSFD